jgi:hypothetical protein
MRACTWWKSIRVVAPWVLAVAWAAPAAAQEVELSHDDGEPAYELQSLSPGDIEAVRFPVAHPSTLRTLRLYFQSVSSDATVVVWADNGGNAPDPERELWRGVVSPVEGDWTEVDVSAEALEYAPLSNIHVGQIVSDASTLLGWDASGSDATHSLARIDGDWYSIGDGQEPPRSVDCLVRVVVLEHDRVTDFGFTPVPELTPGANLSRVAWGDYDRDGDDDLLVNGNRLYRNEGDGSFTDVSEAAGIAAHPANGGVWADYDNDGWLDFYATRSNYLPPCDAGDPCADDRYLCVQGRCRYRPPCATRAECTREGWSCGADRRCAPPAPETEAQMDHDRLWRNNGDGTFSDVTLAAGSPYDYLPSEGAAWGDMDGDGFVDLYVANYETPTRWTGGALAVGTPDRLWRNEGDGTFSDHSAEAGIHERPPLCGRGVNWADYDDDGWLDVFVSNYRLDYNYLWRNEGFGRFEMLSGPAGVGGESIQGAYGHTIGSQWGDLDNDGDWDLFSANLAHPRFIEFSDKSMLYVNSGAPDYTFTDAREAAGITYYETHSDTALADYDNDGRLDLLITGVYVGYRSFLYKNEGGLAFTDVTYGAGLFVDNGWGAAWADYDDDGDLDLAVRGGPYRNDVAGGNWLKIRLVGQFANRAAIGARVRVRTGDRIQMRQVEGGKGTTTQSSLTLHFGLGEVSTADEVEITWPTWPPQSEVFQQVTANRTITYIEGKGEQRDGGVTPDASPVTPPGDGGGNGCGCGAATPGPVAGPPAAPLLPWLLGLWAWGWARARRRRRVG